MYKRISHNIVEEHFDHPATLPMSIVGMGGTGTIHKTVMQMPPTTFSTVEKDSINAWALLSRRIHDIVISITAGDKDTTLLETQLANDIDKIGQVLAMGYDASVVEAFVKLLNTMALSLVKVIHGFMSGSSGSDAMNALSKLRSDTMALAEFVSVNPLWPAAVVNDIFVSVEDLYMSQARHRINKEYASAMAAADAAYKTLVVKQPNGNASFADIFANGIIAAQKQNTM